jgi:type VI secretion system secreted protein Hcp
MAATDAFIKVGSLKGESTDDKFKDWIDVLAWSWSASNHSSFGSGGGGGSGKVQVSDFAFTKNTDISSPKLLLAMCDGKHFDKIQFKERKAGEKPFCFLEYVFTDCMVTSYATGGSQGEMQHTENVAFSFSKFEFKYNQQANTGGLEVAASMEYSLAKNKGS